MFGFFSNRKYFMAAVQISARVDGKVRDKAAKMLGEYGLDIPGMIRMMLTTMVRTRRVPFTIGTPPVSLDGDSFPNDTAYFKQIPGYWENIVKASKEPVGKGKIYDPSIFENKTPRKSRVSLNTVKNKL